MKIDILKKALEHYALSADCSENERHEVFKAITDCAQVIERYVSAEIFKNECYVVTSDTLSELLNMTTYDGYGRMARKNNGSVSFRMYANICRHDYGLDEATDAQLELGFDIISDLWRDNEMQGANNDDGSFNHNA